MLVRERRRVLAGGDRLQRDVDARPVRLLERELGRPDAVDDAEPVEHLGRERVVGEEPSERAVVVVGHDRPHAFGDLVVRHPVDRREPCALQAMLPALVDDVRPVGELVQPQWKEVQRALVPRVAGEDAAVPRALARQRRQAHELDNEGVRLELARLVRGLVDLLAELLLVDRRVEVGVVRLEVVGELPHVACGSR